MSSPLFGTTDVSYHIGSHLEYPVPNFFLLEEYFADDYTVNELILSFGAQATDFILKTGHSMDNHNISTPQYIEKGIVSDNSGQQYIRYAVKTHFIQQDSDLSELVRQYISPLYHAGDMLFITAKIVSLCEGLVRTREQIRPGILARTLYRFAGDAGCDEAGCTPEGKPYPGLGMHEPYKMQLAIDLAGVPRFLLACACSALTKPFGIHGVYYKVIGHNVADIDGLNKASPFYRDMALMNPENADRICDDVTGSTGIPCAIMDSNDFAVHLLGKCKSFPLRNEDILRVMAENPGDQGDTMTPFVLVRPIEKEVSR